MYIDIKCKLILNDIKCTLILNVFKGKFVD